MALPKIEYQKYNTTLPSTGKKLSFRPFNVNEEKILLTAAEAEDVTEMLNASKQIIQNCFQLDSLDSLTTYDIDFLLLQLRIKSISPVSELFFKNMECVNNDMQECKKTIKLSINLEDVGIKVLNDEGKYVDYKPENQTKDGFKIELTPQVGVIMKHPGLAEKEKVSKYTGNDLEGYLNLLCIVAVYEEETVHTRDDFTDAELEDFYNFLPITERDKINKFMSKIPEMRYETKFTCKECGFTEDIVFDGLESFFDLG